MRILDQLWYKLSPISYSFTNVACDMFFKTLQSIKSFVTFKTLNSITISLHDHDSLYVIPY